MNKATISTITIAGLAMVSALAGCGGQAEVQQSKAGADAGFVSAGKATAAVTMTHSFSAAPAVGQRMQLELVFAADPAGDGDDTIQVEIHADEALAVRRQSGRRVSGGERVLVDLMPQAEGRHYVNVIARLGSGDRAQAKVFSIPVQVGDKAFEPTAQKATVGPDGERLIRMPAADKPD